MSSTRPDVTISEATAADAELVEAFASLVPQLSSSAVPPDRECLQEIVGLPCNTVLIAREHDGGRIVGTLTLVVFRIPTGVRAWIEDVVVASSARGRGVGEKLTRRALEIAHARGARTVELTSRASREAANALYRRIGFRQRETNVYRYSFDD
jgi:ribosomal protein S18 acetylase RimI-like enzyme